MPRRIATLLTSGLLLLGLLAAGLLLRVPYSEMSPGPTVNTLGDHNNQPVLAITGAETYETSGHLNMTTVRVTGVNYRMTMADALRGYTSGTMTTEEFQDIFWSAKVYCPRGETPREIHVPADVQRPARVTCLEHGEDIAWLVEVERQLLPLDDRGRQSTLGGRLEVPAERVGAESTGDRAGRTSKQQVGPSLVGGRGDHDRPQGVQRGLQRAGGGERCVRVEDGQRLGRSSGGLRLDLVDRRPEGGVLLEDAMGATARCDLQNALVG
jgi:hypothetical protein